MASHSNPNRSRNFRADVQLGVAQRRVTISNRKQAKNQLRIYLKRRIEKVVEKLGNDYPEMRSRFTAEFAKAFSKRVAAEISKVALDERLPTIKRSEQVQIEVKAR